MYYFFQKRLDGVTFAEMEYRKYGPLGFGIDIAKVVGRLENPRFELAHDWKGPSLADVAARLKAGDPPIYVSATAETLRVNPHVLEPGDAEQIGTRLRAVLGGG